MLYACFFCYLFVLFVMKATTFWFCLTSRPFLGLIICMLHTNWVHKHWISWLLGQKFCTSRMLFSCCPSNQRWTWKQGKKKIENGNLYNCEIIRKFFAVVNKEVSNESSQQHRSFFTNRYGNGKCTWVSSRILRMLLLVSWGHGSSEICPLHLQDSSCCFT